MNSSLNSVGVRSELILLALPAVLGQAIDPMAQLMETAYIGRLGTTFLLLYLACFQSLPDCTFIAISHLMYLILSTYVSLEVDFIPYVR